MTEAQLEEEDTDLQRELLREKRNVESTKEELLTTQQRLDEVESELKEATASKQVTIERSQKEIATLQATRSKYELEVEAHKNNSSILLQEQESRHEEAIMCVEEERVSLSKELEVLRSSMERDSIRVGKEMLELQRTMSDLQSEKHSFEIETKEACTERDSLKDDLQQRSQTITSLELQLLEAKKELQQSGETLSAERKDLLQAVEEKTKNINDLQRQLEDAKHELAAKEAMHEQEVATQTRRTKTAMDEAAAAVSDLEKAVEQFDLEKAVEQTESKFDFTSKAASSEMVELRCSLEDVKQTRDSLLQTFEAKNKAIEDLDRELTEFKKKQTDDIARFEQQFNEQTENTKSAMDDAATAQHQSSALEKELGEVKSRLSQLTEGDAAEVSGLRRSITDLHANNRATEDKNLKIRNERDELLAVGEELENRVEELEKEMEEAILERAEKDGDALELGAVAASEVEKLGQTIENLQAQNVTRSKTIMVLAQKLTEVTLKKEQVESQLRQQLDGSLHVKHVPIGLRTLRIPEEADDGDNDSVLTGPESVVSGISQASFLENAMERKRRPWRKSFDSKKTDLNGFFRRESMQHRSSTITAITQQERSSSITMTKTEQDRDQVMKDPEVVKALK
jgi:chromosome segregation ATPase